MKNNSDLFEISLKNPEPLIDDFYVKKGGLIISNSPKSANKLMNDNRELLDNITAFKVAEDSKNKEMISKIILNIQNLMKTKGINYSEFASFWAMVDVSYSIYNSLTNSEQLTFLDLVIKKYIEMRHYVYLGYGYTSTTLQVSKDAKSHKRSGSLGLEKCASILNKFGYSKLIEFNISNFDNKDKIFILTDKTGKRLFKEILNKYKIDFEWSKGRDKKMPDVLFKNGNHFFIVEHKHMKEGGGGQDKQITEIINFVNKSENLASTKVHYVTFLDGLYFNLFTKESFHVDGKIKNQLSNIRQSLKDNPQNYFVNTIGFIELLNNVSNEFNKKTERNNRDIIKSPYMTKFEMVNVPLFESVGCGELMLADSSIQEMIPVRKDYMSGGSKYFVLRTRGDSMNKAGINDGDLVLCRKDYHPEVGNKVVALIGDDATIKEYHREKDSVILKPCSTNPDHKPLKFTSNEEIKVQGVVVRVLEKGE
jgi:SOS-response transcriptional repressor LexA